MRNRTFVLLKPDATVRGIIGRVINTFEERGFKICALKMINLSDAELYFLYPSLRDKEFHDQVKTFMTLAPCVAMVLEGHQAVRSAYQLSGPLRNPEEDTGYSIRSRFALWTGCDVVHRADTEAEAERQINFFFEENEIHRYAAPLEFLTSSEAWSEREDRIAQK